MKIICYLGSAALLLGGAAACSSDPSATSATAPKVSAQLQPQPQATAAPEPALLSEEPSRREPEDQVKRAANSARPRESEFKTRQQTTSTATSAGEPARRYPSATAAKSSNSLNDASTPEPEVVTAEASAESPAGGSQNIWAAALVPAQEFMVQPSRDTVLVGRQGTVVAVPAGAWDLPAGTKTVRLEMQEFYFTSDIILAGLSTRSGANLLETGGMLKLEASADGQPVALRPGQRLVLRMPTARKVEGMQLFRGVSEAGQHSPDWQLPPSADDNATVNAIRSQMAAIIDLSTEGRWPEMAGGKNALLKFFDKRTSYSATTLARLRRRAVSPEEKPILKEYSKANRKKIICVARVRVDVDSTGTVQSTMLPYSDPEISNAVLATAKQLPKWRPARFQKMAAPHRPEKINAVGVLSVAYTSAGKRLIGVQWDADATHTPRIERYMAPLIAQARRAGQQQFAAQFASAAPLSMNENLYYEFEAGGLGWINCDRFLEEGPRVEFAVQTAQPNTIVTLVFQAQRSILASSRTEQTGVVFAGVPVGAAATVVAMRREKGITYLATAPVIVGQNAQPNLDFKPVSLEELRTALAKL